MRGSLAHFATHCYLLAQRNILQYAVKDLTIRSTVRKCLPQGNGVGFVRGARSKASDSNDELSSKATEGKNTSSKAVSGENPKKKRKKKREGEEDSKEAKTSRVRVRKRVLGESKEAISGKTLVESLKSNSKASWVGEDWGPDELAPKDPKLETQRALDSEVGPSYATYPSYTRKIEGVIAPPKTSKRTPVLTDLANPSGTTSIATLAHGLDRVLFNPGVHWIQDPRSRVYNFSPYLQTVPDVKDFAFEKAGTFVKSSRDDTLHNLALAKGKKFGGSTSSLTGILSHIYFLISEDRTVDTSNLSRPFLHYPVNFTPAQRMPVSITLRHRDGVHLFDSDNTDDDNTDLHILLFQGTMLENFLTMPKSSFDHLLRSSGKVPPENSYNTDNAYRYAMSDDFVMRSQLDCRDGRLPGTGVFDIKTRATISIRLDSLNYKEGSGYLIRTSHGLLESFEREYYDMIRSAFLKYSFQARIGNMDGIFVAHHNTARIFGFQYIPLTEMDARLFGGEDRGDRVFEKCVGLLEAVSKEIVDCYPNQSISCMVETLENERAMHVWVQPLDTTTFSNHIIQLDVTAQSFVGGKLCSGSDAISTVDKPWLLLWSIAHSSLPQHVIKDNFERAKRRKAHIYCVPSGVEASDVAKLAASADYGFSHTPPDLATAEESARQERSLSEAMFQPASGLILKLRSLARTGREDMERWREEEKEKDIQVWTQSSSEGVGSEVT